MIVLNLNCAEGHRFEGWFASSDSFEQQNGAGQVECPLCASRHIARLPSAPHIGHGNSPAAPPAESPHKRAMRMLASLAESAAAAEDVAERFPEEARRIHAGDAPERAIRGQASLREALELLEEGIPVLPTLGPGKDEIH
ncbi:MAG TPA: DUF1178 family protein [Rhodocyclaceae bacterium]